MGLSQVSSPQLQLKGLQDCPLVGLVGHQIHRKLKSTPVCKLNPSDGPSCVFAHGWEEGTSNDIFAAVVWYHRPLL